MSNLLFGFIARSLLLLTLPALVLTALLLFVVMTPMTGLSAAASWLLFALAILLPILCTVGPVRASTERSNQRLALSWLWLVSPVICLIIIGFIVELSRA